MNNILNQFLSVIKNKGFFLMLCFGFIFIFFLGGSINTYAIDPNEKVKEICGTDGNCIVSGLEDVRADGMAEGDIRTAVVDVINYFFGFFALILFIIVLYAGVQLVFSSGEEEAFGKARKIIIYAIIGMVIVFLSWSIVSFIAGIFNSDKEGGGTVTIDSGTGGEIVVTDNNQSAQIGESSNDNTTSVEELLKKLINELEQLKKSAETGNKLSDTDITLLEQKINQLFDNLPNTSALEAMYFELKQEIERLSQNTDDQEKTSQVINKIDTQVGAVEKTVSDLPQIKAVITANPIKGKVPFTVDMSAEKSSISNSAINLKNTDYHWSIIDPNGIETSLGTGMSKNYRIENIGNYIIVLEIKSFDQNNFEQAIPGKATLLLQATSPDTQPYITVNGVLQEEDLRFDGQTAQNGFILSPEKTTIAQGKIIEKYLWNLSWTGSNGKQIARYISSDQSPVIHNHYDSGKLVVVLTTVDENGNEEKTSAQIIIEDVVAKITFPEKDYVIGDILNLSAEKSQSINGEIIEYNWRISDPSGSTVEYEDEKISEKLLSPGYYNIQLQVSDESGSVSLTNTSIKVGASKPSAVFTYEKNTYNPAFVVFDASGSNDEFSKNLLFSWDFDNDGSFEIKDSKDAQVSYTYEKPRKYTVVLKVTNQFDQETITKKNVSIDSTLSVDFQMEKIIGFVDQPVEFIAESNTGNVFVWDIVPKRNQEILEGKTLIHTFNESGVYRITLFVKNDLEEENKITKKIYIGQKDTPLALPSISLNNKDILEEENLCGSGKHGYRIKRSDTVTFSGKSSLNRDGTRRYLEYFWEIGDDAKEEKEQFTWKFKELSEKGRCFSVSLKVRDEVTKKVSEEQKIFLKVENTLPTLSGLSVSSSAIKIAPVPVSLKAKGVKDLDGDSLTYSWWATRKGESSGNKISQHSTVKPSTVLTLPLYGKEGEEYSYQFHLEIEDENGGKVLSDDLVGESEIIKVLTGKNNAPSLDLRVDKNALKMGDTVSFTANATNPSGANINDFCTFKWDFNGDNIFDEITTENVVSHRYDEFGVFDVRVKVIYRGLITSKTKKITVDRTSKLPYSAFTVQKVGEKELLLNAQNSQLDSSIENNVLEYFWDLDLSEDSDGNGSTNDDVDSTEKIVRNIYDEQKKNVTVQLTIKDSVGGKDVLKRKIDLKEVSGFVTPFIDEENNSPDGENDSVLDSSGQNPSDKNNTTFFNRANQVFNESLKIKTSAPITQLEIFGGQKVVRVNEHFDVFALTQNADGSLYSGPLQFEVIEGEGEFQPTGTQSISGQGSSSFHAVSKGRVKIKVTATETISGLLSETLIFTVE